MSMFEQAARKQYRYPTTRGFVTTEQLWEMPLQSKTGFDLDTTARTINANLKAQPSPAMAAFLAEFEGSDQLADLLEEVRREEL